MNYCTNNFQTVLFILFLIQDNCNDFNFVWSSMTKGTIRSKDFPNGNGFAVSSNWYNLRRASLAAISSAVSAVSPGAAEES